MSRLSDEIRIIPLIAKILAVLSPICGFVLLFMVAIPHDSKLSLWPLAGRVAFSIWPGFLVGVAIAFWGYIYADSKRRGMRYVLWTLLAIFLPNMLGILLYFVMRDPLLAQCPKCGAQGRVNFAFCPQCGAEMASTCPSCNRPMEQGWKTCPYCRAALGQGSPKTA